MKTWEMIKALTENPKLEFKNNNGHIARINGSLLELKTPLNTGFSRNIRLINSPVNSYTADEWELVQEPVDFMTAIKELGKVGVKIRVVCGEFQRVYGSEVLRDDKFHPITTNEILNGKWYIEE